MDLPTLQAAAAKLEKAVFDVQVYYACMCAIAFYEWLSNLRREIPLIWKAEWTLIKAMYLFVRYSGLAHAILDLYAYFGAWKAPMCADFVPWIPAIPIMGVVGSHMILLVQCHAVWNRSKVILILLVPLIFSETIIMCISSFTQIEAVPMLTAEGPCLPRAKSAFCILYFAMPMAFDLMVTVLTALKVIKLRDLESGIGVGSALLNTIIQQSFQYFLFITAANLTNILYYAVDVYAPESSINGPLAIIATELFACRLTLSLRDVKNSAIALAAVGGEKKPRHFVKVVFFGDGQHETTELAPVRTRARPASEVICHAI